MKGHMLAVSSTRCLSNIILFADFVTAFTSNNFIKYTFIKYKYLFNDNKNNCNTQCCMHYQFSSPSSAQDTKTYHFQVKFSGFYFKLLHLKLFQLQVCQYFGDLRFSVTKNRNTRIPRYGQVCRGTYHAKEIPRYTGEPIFFPNLRSNREADQRLCFRNIDGII